MMEKNSICVDGGNANGVGDAVNTKIIATQKHSDENNIIYDKERVNVNDCKDETVKPRASQGRTHPLPPPTPSIASKSTEQSPIPPNSAHSPSQHTPCQQLIYAEQEQEENEFEVVNQEENSENKKDEENKSNISKNELSHFTKSTRESIQLFDSTPPSALRAATGLSSSDRKQVSSNKLNKQMNNKNSDKKQRINYNTNMINKNDQTREFIEVNSNEFDKVPHPTDRMSSLELLHLRSSPTSSEEEQQEKEMKLNKTHNNVKQHNEKVDAHRANVNAYHHEETSQEQSQTTTTTTSTSSTANQNDHEEADKKEKTNEWKKINDETNYTSWNELITRSHPSRSSQASYASSNSHANYTKHPINYDVNKYDNDNKKENWSVSQPQPRRSLSLSSEARLHSRSGSSQNHWQQQEEQRRQQQQRLERQTELRTLLLTAERDLAEVRAECARRGSALDSVRNALVRERSSSQALRDSFNAEISSLRAEHSSQLSQLREQLSVLQGVLESTMNENEILHEDASKRKLELNALMERERTEKSAIMAEYREQTESLIAEQAKEITLLHNTVDKVKGEYEKLVEECTALREAKEKWANAMQEAKRQSENDKRELEERLEELQTYLSRENNTLKEKLHKTQSTQVQEYCQLQKEYEQIQDTLHALTLSNKEQTREHEELIASLQETLEHEQQAHRSTVEQMQRRFDEEFQQAKEMSSRNSAQESKSVENLRKMLDQMRVDKESALQSAYKQLDHVQKEYRTKLNQVQLELEVKTSELAQEKMNTEQLQTSLELLQVKETNLESTIAHISSELETKQNEYRQKEKALTVAHHQQIEELWSKTKQINSELAQAQHELRQRSLTEQQLRNELLASQETIQGSKREHERIIQELEAEMKHHKSEFSSREAELHNELTQSQQERQKLENELVELRQWKKEHAKELQEMMESVHEQRSALQETRETAQQRQGEMSELRRALQAEQNEVTALRKNVHKAETELQTQKEYIASLHNTIAQHERQMLDKDTHYEHQLKAREAEWSKTDEEHVNNLVSLRANLHEVRIRCDALEHSLHRKENELHTVQEELETIKQELNDRDEAYEAQMASVGELHSAEVHKMDEMMNSLRSDLMKSQAQNTQYEEELNNVHHITEQQRVELELALEQSEAARAKWQDDARYREQLNQELQSTVRLLSTRIRSFEDDAQRAQTELLSFQRKLQDAHSTIGKKEAAIGQLNAKLRAYEARSTEA